MDKNINFIKNAISFILPDSTVILFGSRAERTHTEFSDYDVLVLVDKKISILEKRKFQSQIRKKLADHIIPVDIFIESKNEIVVKSQLTNHIVNEALKNGVEI